MIGSDFNTMIFNFEKYGGSIVRDLHCERMEDVISDWEILNGFQKMVSILGKIGEVTFPTLQKS